MDRTLTTHQTNACNRAIEVTAEERRPETGASHHYVVRWHEADESGMDVEIPFQLGPVSEGVNGLTNEVLLAILIDRLEGFQSGPFACPENADALGCLYDALEDLRARTQAREARGVEGTHEP